MYLLLSRTEKKEDEEVLRRAEKIRRRWRKEEQEREETEELLFSGLGDNPQALPLLSLSSDACSSSSSVASSMLLLIVLEKMLSSYSQDALEGALFERENRPRIVTLGGEGKRRSTRVRKAALKNEVVG